jgi:dUTP pyrophosphatase
MTSISLPENKVNVLFFRNAAVIYGKKGLCPSTAGSVGFDLRACLVEGNALVIPPGERASVAVGIAVEPLVPGIAGFVYSRSGLGAVKGLIVAQGVGIIDPDYRGEISVFLLNTSKENYIIQQGERIAQLIFHPCIIPLFIPVDLLSETTRGTGGFGHTGIQ